LTNINLGFEKNLQQVKINVDLELVNNYQLIELLKEFKENVAWIYEDSKGISLDAPPSSLMDSTASPKVKTMKGEVGVCFVAHNTSRVEGRARAPGWD